MKKKILAAIIITIVTCTLLSFSVSASGYDNFTKERDYNALIEQLITKSKQQASTPIYFLYNADENNTWYFDYVKTAYELGILNLDYYDFYTNCTDKVELRDAVTGFAKIASKYLENTTPSNELAYARQIGLISSEEYSILRNINPQTPKIANTIDANSFQYDFYATRKDIQVLTTRLFNIISPGEYINNFSKVVDVDSKKTPNVSLDGVLQMYNLGILAGNSYGMFTPYQHLTIPEYSAIITRICVPSQRQKIDASTYDNFFTQDITVNSYNSISDEVASHYIKSNRIDKTFATNLNPTDIVTYEDVISAFHGVTVAFSKPASASEIINHFYTMFPFKLFLPEEDYSKPATKSKAAIFAMVAITELKEIPITASQCLKPELMSYVYNYELPYVNMALSVGLLENTEQDINGALLTKAELDKMLTIYASAFVTNYAYNTVMYGNDLAHLVTDPDKLPSNSDVYPYILDFAPKEIYELIPEELIEPPIQLENYIYYLYPNTVGYWNEALDSVLNVDYSSLYPAENIRNSYLTYISLMYGQKYFDFFNKTIDEYKQYIIDNEIILSGDATVLLPIVYRGKDDVYYRVRVKLEFEVIHSKTNKNLLLYDRDVTYNGNKFEVYVDLFAGGDIDIGFSIASFVPFTENIVYGGENIVVNKG